MNSILDVDFYLQTPQEVARQLIGQRLVRSVDGRRISGLITETEAYDGESDQACHARRGPTKRNQVMYARGGIAYVYFTYGMHWMLNCVCGQAGYPAAVLIRSIHPLENLDLIQSRRAGIPTAHWCDGPAKLTRALAIDGNLNRADLGDPNSGLVIERGIEVPDVLVKTSARVGIQSAGEPWVSLPWRFFVPLESMKNVLDIPSYNQTRQVKYE